MLGLHVWKEQERLQWQHEGELLTPPNVLTRQSIFSLYKKMTGHLQV